MKQFSNYLPTKLFFGCGELKRLSSEALPGKKAMVVISSGTSMRRFGYLDKVLDALHSNNVETVVFDKILANPIKEHVMEAAAICRNEKCDFVVGLGGGSSIDSAKSIAIMAVNAGDYWDYISGGSGKGQVPVGGALPIVAIPTTAGTGTEADPWTVITNGNEKIGYGIEATFPVLSIVDPELMLSVPPKFTAYQGFDAFFHSAEGYIANIATPVSELYSLKSIELLYKYLPRAVANGNDIEARSNVALASTLAGMVESLSSCTSEHSIEHAMSGYYPSLPHGAGLISISLEYYKAFMNAVPDRFIAMAEAMTGRKCTQPMDFINSLANMQSACGVADIKVSEWGLKSDDAQRIARSAFNTMGGLFGYDQRKLSEEDVIDIVRKSIR